MPKLSPTQAALAAIPLSLAVAAYPPVVLAQDMSKPWSTIAPGNASLVAAGSAIEGARAGIHIRLGKGWKTYWRSPGEVGVPPSFDWSGSRNLRQADILWPAPQRFEDAGIISVGYIDDVLFPVTVVPENPKEPVLLDVKVSYGVCKDICLPRDAHLTLKLEPEPAEGIEHADDALIAQSLARVPKMGEGNEPPALKRASLLRKGEEMRIVADIAVDEDTKPLDLFAEADGIVLPLPVDRGAPVSGVRRFEIALSSDDAAMLLDKPIRYTIVSGDQAREAVRRLGDAGALQGFAGP